MPEGGTASTSATKTTTTVGEVATSNLDPILLDRASLMSLTIESCQAPSRTHRYPQPEKLSSPDISPKLHTRSKRKRNIVDEFLQSVILPPRREADSYLSCYWDHVHATVPILHRKSFMNVYNKIWSNDPIQETGTSDEGNAIHTLRAFYSTFNSVMAMGCQSASSVDDQSSDVSADVFFSRAKDLLTGDVMERGSVKIVQALVLIAHFQQNTDRIDACWSTIGMAIRIAHGSGIDIDVLSENQAQREERRRTWWCCVLLDRSLSIMLGGKPMAGWTSPIAFPALVDDDQLSTDPESSKYPVKTQELSAIAFLVESIKLSDVGTEILKASHTQPQDGRENASIVQDFTSSQAIDERLNLWKQDLPTYLRCPSGLPGVSNLAFKREAVALKCGYLHLQIQLLRPIILRLAQTRFFDARNEERLTYIQRTVARGCVASCVSAAQEQIEIIRTESINGNLPSWWDRVFYLYTAETVILAVLSTPELSKADNHNPDFLEMTLQQGLERLFQEEKPNTTFATRCRSLLLSSRMESVSRRTSLATNAEDRSPLRRDSPPSALDVFYETSPALLLLGKNPDALFSEDGQLGAKWQSRDVEWGSATPANPS